MAVSLGSGDPPVGVLRLTGGLECETYSFRLALRLGARHLVVKVFTSNGSRASTEFENLSMVSAAGVPSPVPVHFDANGDWFGVPAIVMSALPGRPDLHATDVERWVGGAATGLAAIHGVDPGMARVVRVPRWRRWRPSLDGLGDRAAAVEVVLARLHERVDAYPTVFSHDDYNPGNVLFHDGDLSGVVDWADVTVEPAQAAVAQYRHLLAIHPGGAAPEQFLAAYLARTGRSLADLSLWDVLYGLRGLPAVEHWVRAFDGLGVTVTVSDINTRSRDWIRRSVHRSMG
jgi:aminoglycoside phosphotransferase (APT) family kinase protein